MNPPDALAITLLVTIASTVMISYATIAIFRRRKEWKDAFIDSELLMRVTFFGGMGVMLFQVLLNSLAIW